MASLMREFELISQKKHTFCWCVAEIFAKLAEHRFSNTEAALAPGSSTYLFPDSLPRHYRERLSDPPQGTEPGGG